MFEIEFDHFRESHKHNEAAHRAIEDLTTALGFFRPRMVELTHLLENSSKLDGGDEIATEGDLEAVSLPRKKFGEYRQALDAGDRIMQDLQSIKAPSPWFVPPVTDPVFVKAWPAIIPDLIEMFHDAIPDIGTGVTNGSLNKCLAAVIPSITGERPTPAQIYSWRRGKG